MTTNNVNNTPAKPATSSIFNSNETLELCDVHISKNGKIVVETKPYHREQLERLGTPDKAIRGRVKWENPSLVFEPYAEASRRPTYSKKIMVGNTTIALTAENMKLSLVLSRKYSKETLALLIEAEFKEVLRRLEEDLYEEFTIHN